MRIFPHHPVKEKNILPFMRRIIVDREYDLIIIGRLIGKVAQRRFHHPRHCLPPVNRIEAFTNPQSEHSGRSDKINHRLERAKARQAEKYDDIRATLRRWNLNAMFFGDRLDHGVCTE